ncbi:MAG: tRNA (guanosine(46)-N7)-methyltransferase TrmB [Clostridiales Family XIII bacterium]|jgi:tRNA (guanine-N7-)-methyltransferase|nr:tRNA (guanosine(46)-N7)-methyltransferase TrmB [Clostridiales Family XIII bacterium]
MRQRKIKDAEQKSAIYSRFLADEPAEKRGSWRRIFDENESTDAATARERRRLYAEFGCGKGRFIAETASRDPCGAYLGFEGQATALYRALTKVAEFEPANLRLCAAYVFSPAEYFAQAELCGIYLNFSDPWPKARHEKRRLTSPAYLEGYLEILESGGFLRLKTDDDGFFAYSRDGIAALRGFEIVEYSEDLHRSAFAARNVMTEYERKFLNLNRTIKYLSARRV